MFGALNSCGDGFLPSLRKISCITCSSSSSSEEGNNGGSILKKEEGEGVVLGRLLGQRLVCKRLATRKGALALVDRLKVSFEVRSIYKSGLFNLWQEKHDRENQ